MVLKRYMRVVVTVFAAELLCVASSVTAGYQYWTDGDPIDRLWMRAENWNESRVPDGNDSLDITSYAVVGPIIEEGISAQASQVGVGSYSPDSGAILTMTGGDLTVGDWMIVGGRLGHVNSGKGILDISGGSIDMGGGWFAVGNGGVEGLVNMTGGTINAGWFGIGRDSDGASVGHVNLDGGEIVTLQFVIFSQGSLDIEGGILRIAGDVESEISLLVWAGQITAYGNQGKVLYDTISTPGWTTVTAVPPQTADMSDDYCVNSQDFSLLGSEWSLGTQYDEIQADGMTIVSVVDEYLDIARQLEKMVSEATKKSVHPGPRIVVGEGLASENHTVVRVLNRYGIAELQFLAYPTSVQGGVNVNTGRFFSTDLDIVTSPLSDTANREIRVFSQEGVLLSSFSPSDSLNAPFAVAAGDYLWQHNGDEIAVASFNQAEYNRDIFIYTGCGQLLTSIPSPEQYSGSSDILEMSTVHGQSMDELLLWYKNTKKAVVLTPSTEQVREYIFTGLPDGSTVYESAFSDRLFDAGGAESVFSTLWAVDSEENTTAINVGARENSFWVHPAEDHAPWPDTDYIKNGRFLHLRTDQATPAYYWDLDFTSDDYDHWAGGSFQFYIDDTQADYATGLPGMWEPTFTHRHSYNTTVPWQNEIDPETGLYKYRMLSRMNNPGTYLEGESLFACYTYALDLPAIDHLYIWPLRAYLCTLAEKFRGLGGNPEQLIGVEPNHEFEIYMDQDDSIGDYNPKMISGFYSDLQMLYNTLSKINSRFNTNFSGSSDFDAPRNLSRGAWDAYSTGNAFFNAWVQYNRKVIFYRLLQGFCECLFAGFPPEAIKTHQIPANYAVYGVIDSRRITPIDWIFSAGTGYGGTRYGLWYWIPSNWIQGAFSSGQTMISVGEYHPITNDQASANNQARYMFENGVNFIHCMGIDDYSQTLRNSYLSLQDGNLPREGTTAGIGKIRAVWQPEGSGTKFYDIVSVGTGDNHAGLLKSVKRDGSWEGTVYVVPFHAHIDLVPVGAEEQNFHLTTTQYNTSIAGLMAGDQIEIRFKAKTDDPNGMFTLLALHDGIEMPDHRHVVAVGQDWGFFRYVLRIQLPMDNVTILINSGERDTPTGYNQDIEIEEFSVLVHKERVTRIEYGISQGEPHVGGVTFDILSISHIPESRILGDLNTDGAVDLADLTIFADQWLSGDCL